MKNATGLVLDKPGPPEKDGICRQCPATGIAMVDTIPFPPAIPVQVSTTFNVAGYQYARQILSKGFKKLSGCYQRADLLAS